MARTIADEHSPTPEELMAYLDGEVAPERAAVIHEHLSACESCRQLRDELRQTSHELLQWNADAAPATLRAPVLPATTDAPAPSPRVWWRRPALVWQLAGGAALVTVFMFLAVGTGHRTRPVFSAASAEPPATVFETPDAPLPPPPISAPSSVNRGVVAGRPSGGAGRSTPQEQETIRVGQPAATAKPMIARTARLRITTDDFDAARPALDRILRDVSGFVGQIDAAGSRGAARSLTATLRVPADRLDAALAALKALGRVDEESQTGDEVTEQMVDLEARLSNARTTEKRLRDLLSNRTGDVADVLSVEREIMRVRGEIERFEAERKNLEGRVTYATVLVQITEQRKAALDLGPLPVSARFRNALVDGWRDAFESALAAMLFALRIAPVLLLWGVVLVWPARVIWRRFGTSLTRG
jgi:anti-sigma factor RsiW